MTSGVILSLTQRRRANRPGETQLGQDGAPETGLAALPGKEVTAVKAGPIELATDMSVAMALHVIADACLRQFRRNEMLLADGDAEAVHQARVALRRLRSVLSVFKAVLADDAFERLKGDLKWLSDTLGGVRDLDILLGCCRDDELRGRLMQAREAAFQDLIAVLASPRARGLMLDLADWFACGAWRSLPGTRKARKRSLDDFAAGALDELHRKVRKGGRNLAGLDDAARHDLRKNVKKLRYATHFFASLFNDKRRKRHCEHFLTVLATLQDRLGALNDAATTPAVLARIGLEQHAASALLSGITKNDREMLVATTEAHDDIVAMKRFWR